MKLTALLLAGVASVFAFPSSELPNFEKFRQDIVERQSESELLAPRGAVCAGNTATTRSSWCQYDTSTDYYNTPVNTGVVREYFFEISNITLAPDGVPRLVQAINGTIPGPTIEGNWGDTFVIHVNNAVQHNGTTIHFHGIRQNYTNQADGASSITECPTAPGQKTTYTWVASQYGSSWYHSHFSLQAWDGVYGGIVIHGPATANYDNDLGNIILSDWSHSTADSLYHTAQLVGPVELDTGLINGLNTWNNDTVGKRFQVNFQAGSSYLLRLVNVAIDSTFAFSIDNHTMTVIAMDFVPIVPYTTDVVNIQIAQRYDVVVTANQGHVASDFWMRAFPDPACSSNANPTNIKGIVHYGTSTGTPTTTGYPFVENNCLGEPAASLVPFLPKNAGPSTARANEAVSVAFNSDHLFRWYLSGSTFNSSWADPVALQIVNGVTSFNSSLNVFKAPTAGDWYYIIFETAVPVTHPIHLHGHDFYQLAQGTGSYNSSVTLNLNNPPRRDVAALPGGGYLVFGFLANNPGAWLVHCHIGWHTEEGLSLVVVEQEDQIAPLYNVGSLEETCNAWDTYQAAESNIENQSDDDGI